MAQSLRFGPPGRQFGSAVPRGHAKLLAALCAVFMIAALAVAASASADVTGPFCGSPAAPMRLQGGQGCTHSAPHSLYAVSVHSTLSYANACALAKGNADGSGPNIMTPACGPVGYYGLVATCGAGQSCIGYARILNQNSVARDDWGYLYAYF